MNADATPALALETRLSRLESIVVALEREDLELEQALELFEEGIGHLRSAQALLRETELRVEQLLEDAAGELSTEPLERDDG